MKTLNIFLLALALLLTACSTESEPQIDAIDYSGIYTGNLDCMGDLPHEHGDEVTFVITERQDNTYNIDFGDDTIFVGHVENNKFIVDLQTINQGQGFDEITMELEIVHLADNEFMIDLTFTEDFEGAITCNFVIRKN